MYHFFSKHFLYLHFHSWRNISDAPSNWWKYLVVDCESAFRLGKNLVQLWFLSEGVPFEPPTEFISYDGFKVVNISGFVFATMLNKCLSIYDSDLHRMIDFQVALNISCACIRNRLNVFVRPVTHAYNNYLTLDCALYLVSMCEFAITFTPHNCVWVLNPCEFPKNNFVCFIIIEIFYCSKIELNRLALKFTSMYFCAFIIIIIITIILSL